MDVVGMLSSALKENPCHAGLLVTYAEVVRLGQVREAMYPFCEYVTQFPDEFETIELIKRVRAA